MRLCTLTSIALTTAIAACGGDPATAPAPNPGALALVILTPDSIVLAPSQTRRLSAELRDAAGAVLPAAPLTWKTSAGVVATVASDGTVSGVAPGRAVVSATSGAVGDSTVVMVIAGTAVVATVQVTGRADSLLQGETSIFKAIALDANGNAVTGQRTTWAGTTVASVDSMGLVTALRDGRAAITATIGHITGQLDVHVIDTVATASVTPSPLVFGVGGSVAMTGTLKNDRGEIIGVAVIGGDRTLDWSTSSPELTVTSTGLVSASLTPVDATVTATTRLEHKAFSAHLTTRTFRFTGIGAGSDHVCGLSSSGEPACWGINSREQLGIAGAESIPAPVGAGGGRAFRTIAGGITQTCGLTAGGEAWCWGGNDYGSIGIPGGPFTDPVLVPGGYTFVQLTAGGNQTCGLTASGLAVCAGARAQTTYLPGPVVVTSPVTFTALAVGDSHVCGLSPAGTAYCWGDNVDGQLGDGTKLNRRDDPAPVAASVVFASIAAGGNRTCGISTAGDAYCWGGGAIGDGTELERLVPTLVQASGIHFTQLAVFDHVCGLSSGGAVYCWGPNVQGQSGSDLSELLLVPEATGVTASAIVVGLQLSCAVAADGVYCWGRNRDGQLGAGAAGAGLATTRGRGPIRVAGQQ